MFTLILGPMKSGKSVELIAQVAPYEHTERKVLYIQPAANVRDKGIQSRLGVNANAVVVKSLREIRKKFDVIGIDEVHMFDESDVEMIEKWLLEGKTIIASGIDTDYRGKLLPVTTRLLELKPNKLMNKISVCDACKDYSAPYTQILSRGKPVLSGLPPVVPDDGTYDYQPRCRVCFVKG